MENYVLLFPNARPTQITINIFAPVAIRKNKIVVNLSHAG